MNHPIEVNEFDKYLGLDLQQSRNNEKFNRTS